MNCNRVIAGFGLALVSSAVFSQATDVANPEPRAGQWRIERKVQGTPRDEPAKIHTVCLTDAQLQAPVNAIRNAALEGATSAPRCTMGKPTRSGSELTWKAECAPPNGGDPVPASGRALVAAAEVEIFQEFRLSLPFGKFDIKESIKASHVGACK